MQKYGNSLWITFLLVLFFFMSTSAFVDSSRGNAWAAEPEGVSGINVPERAQAFPAAVETVAGLAAERSIAVPPPETTPDQARKDAAVTNPDDEPDSASLLNDQSKSKSSADKKPLKKAEPSPTQQMSKQTPPVAAQAAPEKPSDKSPSAPSNEAASVQVSKDASASAAPAAVSPEKPKTSNVSLIDNSHVDNETALKAIERNISLFKNRLRERFSVWLERSAKYIEIMKDVLREKDLPEELVFLPIIESGFNLNAYSRARAVGPWQFIAATAKRYGLVIDWWRDERKDPVKSTRAAAEYLKDLYKMFGSWNLALAAYNAGEGRIARALKKSDTIDYWSLVGTKQLADETKEYVPRYIAATMIANTPEEYGFNNLEYHDPLEYDEVTITGPLDIGVIAQCAECTVKEIRELNPELRRWSTPPNVPQYTVRVPAGSKESFLKKLSAIPTEKRFTVETYVARKGDTVRRISRKTGAPVSAILAMNSFSGIERINAGDTIKIPPREMYSPDLDDKIDNRSLIKKAVYKKRVSDKRSAKKRIGKRGKKGASKIEAKAKNKSLSKSRVKVKGKSKSKGRTRTKRA